MKLKHILTSIVTFIFSHIILMQLTTIPYFISATETSEHDHREPHEDINYYQISEENKKILNDQFKEHLTKVLGLKEVPKKPASKAYVPKAILEEYRKVREEVRESIPEDRDFYGKIDLDDLDQTDDDFWGAVYNKYHSYDITVDMSQRKSEHYDETTENRHMYIKGEFKQISSIPPQDEPEDVPKSVEKYLPHLFGQEGQAISVHLKFNLSQQFFTNPPGVDEVRKADLHMSREKVFGFLEENDSDRKPVPFFSQDNINETIFNSDKEKTTTSQTFLIQDKKKTTSNKKTEPPDRNKKPSRYQIVRIIRIRGYDKDQRPLLAIFDSKRVDITENTPLVFDIRDIVKDWMENPKSNYGLIVAVLNDFEGGSLSSNVHQNDEILEHVRLKRAFRSSSESNEVWQRKQPYILVYYSPSTEDSSKRHVKRDHQSANTRDSRQTFGPSQYNRNAGRSSSTLNQNQKPKTKIKPNKNTEKCSMRTLSINFEDVGWSSWIIAPTAYYANYCAGDCSFPHSDHQNATNHAIIQSIFHSAGRVIPRPCCAATKLGRMALLYQLDGSVQVRHYDDMIVEACGCL